MKTYDIQVQNIGDWLWAGSVSISDGGQEILNGNTTISCETQEEAIIYIERTFLPDLRVNYSRLIGDMVFDWELGEDDA